MRTPLDKQIVMTFHSHPVRNPKACWTARLVFPPGADGATELALTVIDGEDVPIKAGTFELAGLKLKVKDGAAKLTYAEFIGGKHEKAVWLHRRGMMPIPGGLTFE